MTFRNASTLSGRLALTTLSIAALSLAGAVAAHADITIASGGTGGVTFTTTTTGTASASVLFANGADSSPLTGTESGYINLGAPGAADGAPYAPFTPYAGSSFIGPSGANSAYGGYDVVAKTGTYEYAFTFGGNFTSLSGSVFTDNGLLGVYLDGVALSLSSISNGGSTANTFSTGTFGGSSAASPHTLDFLVYNYNGASAIDFTASGTTATPEPGMWVTAASMLSMTGLGLVRGRRRSKATMTACTAA